MPGKFVKSDHRGVWPTAREAAQILLTNPERGLNVVLVRPFDRHARDVS